MDLKPVLIRGMVLCLLLLNIYADSGDSKTRRKRCRCKKYIEKMNRDIDDKLAAFENRFEKYFYQKAEPTNYSVTSPDSEQKLDYLTESMNKTRHTLRKETFTLKRLQKSINSQERNVDNLNSNFQSLESIVRNLTRIVEKLEHTMLMSISHKPQPLMDRPGRGARTRSGTTRKVGIVKPKTPATYPKDCDEVFQSGGMQFLGDYYIMVQPKKAPTPFKSVCKMIDGGGWTVIQRRQDGRENFSRNWEEYKHGFGDLQGEFWLGNENIHLLTSQGDFELKIDMEDFEGRRYYAEYDSFRVGSEKDKYKLQASGYHGTAGDSLTPYWRTHDGVPFSTRDNDNDNRFYDNCAEHYGGGWWYNDCFESHLNGKYYQNGSHTHYFIRNGIQWNSIHSYSSLKFVEMMIKPSDKAKQPNEV